MATTARPGALRGGRRDDRRWRDRRHSGPSRAVLAPWVASVCPGAAATPASPRSHCYDFIDPCACRLCGKHPRDARRRLPDGIHHPSDSMSVIESPICDIGTGDPHSIFIDFDMYAQMPNENGVLFRGLGVLPVDLPRARVTRAGRRRVGERLRLLRRPTPVASACATALPTGPSGRSGPPTTSEKVIGGHRAARQTALPSPSIRARDGANASPLFDNIAVGVDGRPCRTDHQLRYRARVPGCRLLPVHGVRSAGSRSCECHHRHLHGQRGEARLCGDSLSSSVRSRPPAIRTRAGRRGSGGACAPRGLQRRQARTASPARYKTWRDRVADGQRSTARTSRSSPSAGWTRCRSDRRQPGTSSSPPSVRTTTTSSRESSPENEMIWDDVLYPGHPDRVLHHVELREHSEQLLLPARHDGWDSSSSSRFCPGSAPRTCPDAAGSGLQLSAPFLRPPSTSTPSTAGRSSTSRTPCRRC